MSGTIEQLGWPVGMPSPASMASPQAAARAAQAVQAAQAAGDPELAKAQKAAKDFEAILLNQVFEEMQKTVPQDGLFDSPATQQTQSMVWMFLSQDLADKGGMGLWQDLYRQLGPRPAPSTEALR